MKSISILCIALLIKFTATKDPVGPSTEESLKKFLLDKYNKNVRPPDNKTDPVPFVLALNLISIQDVDVSQQTADMDVRITLGWMDSRLQWERDKYGNTNQLRISTNQLWTPDISLYNSAGSPDSLRAQLALVFSWGYVQWVSAIHLSAMCEFHMTYYPYDTHNCSLDFGLWDYDGFHLDLVSSGRTGISLSSHWESNDWEVVSTYVQKRTQNDSCCDTQYPVVTASMTLRRHSTMQQAAILFPIAAVILLAFTAFLFSIFDAKRLFINVFNILVNMLTLLHLQQQLPVVGRSCPAIVLICESMILLLSLAIVWSFVTMSTIGRYKGSRPPPMVLWLINSWLTKVLFVSRGDHMEECNKKTLDITQLDDQEVTSMLREDKSKATNDWMTFLSILDRLAFLTFTIIVFALVIAFTH